MSDKISKINKILLLLGLSEVSLASVGDGDVNRLNFIQNPPHRTASSESLGGSEQQQPNSGVQVAREQTREDLAGSEPPPLPREPSVPFQPAERLLRELLASFSSSNSGPQVTRQQAERLVELDRQFAPIRSLVEQFFPSRSLVPSQPVELSPEKELVQAILAGDTTAVAFLLEAGVNPNLIVDEAKKDTLGMAVVRLRSKFEQMRPGLALEIAQLLINAPNFDPNLHNADRDTILHICILYGAWEILNLLLDLPNTNVNGRNGLGQTTLHLLVQKVGHPNFDFVILPIIGRMVNHSTYRADARDEDGLTVKERLENTRKNVDKIYAILAEKEVERSEPSPEEALRDAIMGQDLGEIGRIIAEHGSTLNRTWIDTGGRNLLMLAVVTGDPEIVRIILDAFHGIDLTTTDDEGKTAMDYAESNRNDEIINMLGRVN
jgi:ankyrin repeat protein